MRSYLILFKLILEHDFYSIGLNKWHLHFCKILGVQNIAFLLRNYSYLAFILPKPVHYFGLS